MAWYFPQFPFTRSGNASALPNAAQRRIYSPAEMARLLERERDRADRTGTPFAMIVFQADRNDLDREVLDALVRVLASRLRISDEFGYLNRRHLAAVLPGASAANAWTVSDEVCLRLPPSLPLPRCEVYAYPSESAEEMDGNRPTDARLAGNSRRNGSDGNGNDGNGEHDRRVIVPQANCNLESEPVPCHKSDAQAARPLEPLFIRPLPWWKRAMDIVVASAALMALSPVLLLVAVAVRLTSPGPILFRQMRSGLGGRPFVFYKFRSMVPDAEARKANLLALNEQDGPAFKIRHDPRITVVGRFLRKTSVDELPQLWNVLRGDMSLVGPRPLPCSESDACTGWHRRRLDVTPGLTCIWQVEGRSRVSFDDWVRMDIRYMRFHSLLKDATLMIRTLPAMLLRRGV